MIIKNNQAGDATQLRKDAEEMARENAVQSTENIGAMSPETIRQMLHELRVHQIELEMQNEELRSAQVELDAARARYYDLYDLAPVGYITVSEKGLIREANLTAATQLGSRRNALVKRPITRFILKEDQDIYYLHSKRLIETAMPQECDLRMLGSDGTMHWAHLASTVVQDVDGSPIARIVMIDITERKKLEGALHKAYEKLEQKVVERTAELVETNNELKQEIKERMNAEKTAFIIAERYAAAIAGSSDGIWDWDILSNIVFYSDRFKEILGYAPEEFPETLDAFRSRLHPEDADNVWAAVESHLKERVPYNIEYRMKTKSGEYRWFLARGQAIWDGKGNATRMAGSLQDITERMEGVQSLQNALLEVKELKNLLEAEKAYLQDELKLENNQENIIGQSDGLKYVLYKVEQIAGSDTTVLVLGETGTGKELVARAIHGLSPRKKRALIKVNCAALPSNLIESELFGHEKGAFTGSDSRHIGRFEVANGATLFLDEIGELPLELQPKLLRVLQDGEFERLGSSRTIKVDVRIIAATNRNLEEEVRKGRFREDLWYRLNVFPISMPPLRDRMKDIPLIVDFYVKKISKRMGKTIEMIPVSVMNALQNYHWPGNVRELENVLERAVINSSGPKLRLADKLNKPSEGVNARLKTLEAVERDYIVRTLDKTHWKVGGKNSAAEILGLDRSTLRARMRKLGIQKP